MILFLLGCDADGPADKPDPVDDTNVTETGEPCTPLTWYADGDGDSVCGAGTTEACEAPAGFVATPATATTPTRR
jgi:hypothetical protein